MMTSQSESNYHIVLFLSASVAYAGFISLSAYGMCVVCQFVALPSLLTGFDGNAFCMAFDCWRKK